MYKCNSPTDGYSTLELLLSKLNPTGRKTVPAVPVLEKKWRPSDKMWYENRPLCINKLSTRMKDNNSAAGLSCIHSCEIITEIKPTSSRVKTHYKGRR